MPLHSIPNPTREITIKLPGERIRIAILEVVQSFPNEYLLVENDPILNTFRVKVTEQDSISKLFMDMGQQLDISLHENGETDTRVSITISRIVGTIDKPFEANRATDTINTFLTLISQSLQGKLQELIEKGKDIVSENEKIAKKNTWIIWVIVAAILIFFIYKIMEARAEHGA